MGANSATVTAWFKEPLFLASIEAMIQQVNTMFAELQARITFTAMQELQDMAKMPLDKAELTAGQKVQVLKEILDRNQMTAKVPIEATPPSQVNIFQDVRQLSDEELLSRARQIGGAPQVIDTTVVEEK